jgi:aminoglycoside phosphotransferase family enzyme
MRTSPQDAMRSPAFYPDGPASVEMVESHISWVFLAGDRAYKLRKPVVFPFLDYETAERRRAMCEEEVRLGRRLAPNVYRGVRPLVRTTDGWALGAAGETGAEHVVEMRRFDPTQTLAARLRDDTADEVTIRAVARRIAAFHADAESAPTGSFDPEAVAATVSENFGRCCRTRRCWASAISPPPTASRSPSSTRGVTCWRNGSRAVSCATVTAICAPST